MRPFFSWCTGMLTELHGLTIVRVLMTNSPLISYSRLYFSFINSIKLIALGKNTCSILSITLRSVALKYPRRVTYLFITILSVVSNGGVFSGLVIPASTIAFIVHPSKISSVTLKRSDSLSNRWLTRISSSFNDS
jgi:hypothetical protein